MFRYLLAFILGIHGFFHMMGFAKAANPAGLAELTIPVSKGFGSLWMACAFLFIAAGGTYLSRKDWWWMLALAAVVLSQYLIICFWADARYGTFVNVVVLVAAVVGIGQWQFGQATRREVAALHDGLGQASVVVNAAMLEPLPVPVARWLERAGGIGRPLTRIAYLRQAGTLRTAPDGAWMPFSAEQWFAAERPGFVWRAEIAAGPGVHIAGRDSYRDAQGRMRIMVMSLYPMADATGPEIDQGAQVRVLAEIIWMPSAALRDYITWAPDGDRAATATMADGGRTVTARFEFDSNGDPIHVDAERYYTRDDGATLETWHIVIDPDSYGDFDGLRIPARAAVTWKLPAGDFTWYHVEIEHAEYNRAGGG